MNELLEDSAQALCDGDTSRALEQAKEVRTNKSTYCPPPAPCPPPPAPRPPLPAASSTASPSCSETRPTRGLQAVAQGQAYTARRIIGTRLEPRYFSQTASYDVASDIECVRGSTVRRERRSDSCRGSGSSTAHRTSRTSTSRTPSYSTWRTR